MCERPQSVIMNVLLYFSGQPSSSKYMFPQPDPPPYSPRAGRMSSGKLVYRLG